MPGIGKTTSIHCLAHQLLGDAYKEGVLELNASDERCVTCLLLLSCIELLPVELTLSEIKSRPSPKKKLPFLRVDIRLSFLMKPTGQFSLFVCLPCFDSLILKHDSRCSTSPSAYDGDLLEHDAILPCLQYE